MYVIFEDGSRQYRVSVGDTVRLDFRDVAVNSTIELDRVLLCADGANVAVGQPTVTGAKVIAEVTGFPKVKQVIQHFRRRKNYRRLKGHTQPYLEVKIKEIVKPS
jgi:large subunit ribosomal protein L21